MTAAVLVTAAALAGCGNGNRTGQDNGKTNSDSPPKLELSPGVVTSDREEFDPAAIYRREAPGVVTVVSSFKGERKLLDNSDPEDGNRGLGSGFVISKGGEIATNAHVVTVGEENQIEKAKEVYVEFGDGNRVPAEVVGFDPDVDVALLKVDSKGLTLRPLTLGSSKQLVVGSPVAAIGSPFGEPQSLSVGVISALDRSIDSLTGFGIPGAIQTDAAINHGNSGGPLVNAVGSVIGVNSQIRSTGGGGEGVGFAVPIEAVKRSLDQLRENGKAKYGYLGVATVPVFPQLADRFDLPVESGAYLQEVTPNSPADKAGLAAGKRKQHFQIQDYLTGGDIITAVNGNKITAQEDIGELISRYRPGETVRLETYHGDDKRTVSVKLGSRPDTAPDKDSDRKP